MTAEEGPSPITVVHQTHQMLMEQVERGSAKIRSLAAITIVVTLVLGAAYLYQVVLPLMGVTSVTVNTGDPALIIFELGVLALNALWLYVAVRDFRFTGNLSRKIREIRASDAEIAKKYSLEPQE